jgi:hypothetical protein
MWLYKSRREGKRNISEEVAYWRKANAIHRWFVENVQGGVDNQANYYVSREQLQQLLDAVNKVLADRSLAAEELPTQDGFFFGGTGYDEYYFSDLERTKEILEAVLKEDGVYDYYYTCWW